MIVTFCGHAHFSRSEEYEQQILAFLEEKVGDQPADMFLGGYGDFDHFAYVCCKKYQKTHPNISLVLVTPYPPIDSCDSRFRYCEEKYDCILYPALENVPKKFAIVHRNRYMAEKADYVVAFVSHGFGGAYTTYQYAKRKGKKIFNLANFEDANGNADTDGHAVRRTDGDLNT